MYLNYFHDPCAIKEGTFGCLFSSKRTQTQKNKTNCLINYSLDEIMTRPRYPHPFCKLQKKAGGGGERNKKHASTSFHKCALCWQERETKEKRAGENRGGREGKKRGLYGKLET